MEIEDFYPKYPLLSPTTTRQGKLNELDPYAGTLFDTAIDSKLEFSELKLRPVENVPRGVKGHQLNHQKYIARFMSSITGYDELLLFHEMGTGKTCTAISAMEKLRYEKQSFVKGAVVLAKGHALLKNFIEELLFTCTDGRYVPDNYSNLSDLERIHRTRKIVSEFYEFETFEIFAKKLSDMTDEQISIHYENHVIVVDEVHNMREKFASNEDGEEISETPAKQRRQLDIYRQFHRFFHVLKRRKILLLSGSPMKDGPEELASVMNLILPLTNQLETDADFLTTYFDRSDKIVNVERLQAKLAGRISYLKSVSDPEVGMEFIGSTYGDLKYFKVSRTVMSEFQTAGYVNAYEKDARERSIYTNSRQASLFVYPDGTYGHEGFSQQRYIFKQAGNKQMDRRSRYVLGADLVRALRPNSLEDVTKYSSKYAFVIGEILVTEKSFVYIHYVNGSGSIIFSKILERFGYSQAFGNESFKSKRYALLTNQTSTAKSITKIISRFNDPDNIDGEYISVIIGSRVISEGFTLKDVRKEFVVTGHWNYVETAQAIARGWRIGSNVNRLERGDTDTTLKVYQCVSVPHKSSSVPSIDLDMYAIAERKDVMIKRIERVIKISAFDCALTYDRNHMISRRGLDDKRECDYDTCDYTCRGRIESKPDVSTYKLYYGYDDIIDSLKKALAKVFRKVDKLPLEEFKRMFPHLDIFEISHIIVNMINESVTFVDRFNFPCFVKLINDVLYVTYNPALINDANKDTNLNAYYVENNVLEDGRSFEEIVREMSVANIPLRIKRIFESTGDIKSIVLSLSHDVQRLLLRGSIESKMKGLKRHVDKRDVVLNLFKSFYQIDDDASVAYTWLYSDDIKPPGLRYENDEWTAFDPAEIIERKRRAEVQRSPIGYYGLYNPQLKEFCLRELTAAAAAGGGGGKIDLRKINVGRRCVDWEHVKLVHVVARAMKIDPHVNYLKDSTDDDLKTRLDDMKGKKGYEVLDTDYETADSMRRIIYWNEQSRKNICERMKTWFVENNLMEDNFDCGQQKKRRGKFNF